MSENPKPHVRWSGIVGEAPQPVAPLEQKARQVSLPPPVETSLHKQVSEREDSPDAPEGTKSAMSWLDIALVWITTMVLLVFSAGAGLLCLYLVRRDLMPLLAGKTEADFGPVALSVIGVVAGAAAAKFLYDGWQVFRRKDITCASSLGWVIRVIVELITD